MSGNYINLKSTEGSRWVVIQIQIFIDLKCKIGLSSNIKYVIACYIKAQQNSKENIFAFSNSKRFFIRQLSHTTQLNFHDSTNMFHIYISDVNPQSYNNAINTNNQKNIYSNEVYIFFLLQLKYFNDPILRALQQLDNIELRDPSQRGEVYTYLSQVIPSIPKVRYQLITWCSINQSISQTFQAIDSSAPPHFVFGKLKFRFNNVLKTLA